MEILRGRVVEVELTPEPDLLAVATLSPLISDERDIWRARVHWAGAPTDRADFHVPVRVGDRVALYCERGFRAELNQSTGEFYPMWTTEQLRRQIILGLIGAPLIVGLVYLISLAISRRAYNRIRRAVSAELEGPSP